MAKVTVSQEIPASQTDVWAVLTDLPQATRWNKNWTSIELTSPQTHGIGMTFRANTESGEAFDFEVCDWSAPDSIAFCPIRRAGEPEYAITLDSHSFRLSMGPEPGITLVELTASASAHGLRGMLISTFFWPGHQRAGLNSALDNLASIFHEEGGGAEQASSLPSLEE